MSKRVEVGKVGAVEFGHGYVRLYSNYPDSLCSLDRAQLALLIGALHEAQDAMWPEDSPRVQWARDLLDRIADYSIDNLDAALDELFEQLDGAQLGGDIALVKVFLRQMMLPHPSMALCPCDGLHFDLIVGVLTITSRFAEPLGEPRAKLVQAAKDRAIREFGAERAQSIMNGL